MIKDTFVLLTKSRNGSIVCVHLGTYIVLTGTLFVNTKEVVAIRKTDRSRKSILGGKEHEKENI
jgi:hypothetical protein